MRNYESMVVIDASLPAEEIQKENQTIINLIKDNGGELVETDEWGKRKLAYEIKKKKEGHYFINYFTLDPTKLNEIDNHYRINEKILRYNLLVKE